MTFIPNGPKVGDRVVLTRDVEVLKGTFKRGTRMTITSLGTYRGPDMVDDEGNALGEVFDSSSYRVEK